MSTMLEVKNLTKHFPVKGSKTQVVHAVDGISFSVEKGRTLGIVGESGCGKSTCAPRSSASMIPPRAKS
jgi:oligopeptide transport system ATP-binding protein